MPSDRVPGDFGGKLRDARERKGISLRQIANATKISVAVLEALERNDISRLPGGIFSRAFVRSYAAEVGLDPEATIQSFIAQFPHDSVIAGHAAADQFEDREALESDRRMAATFLWILAVSIPIAGAVLYFSAFDRRAAPTPETTVSSPPTSAATPTERDHPPSAIAEPAPAPSVPAPSQSAPADAAAREAAPPVTEVSDHLTVGLSALRPVWVSATVDGHKAIERLLQTGEKRTIEVQREMVITVGDASAISMTLNGAAARILGQAGDVVTARLNLSNFKDYLQTR